MRLPIHSYTLSSKQVGVERLLNCYAEAQPPEGKGPTSIVRASGIKPGVSGSGIGRGLFTFQQVLYAVSGTTLYKIDAQHKVTSLGTVSGNQLCTFAANASQLTICDPDASYVFDGSLNRITDPDFLNGKQCAGIDSYVLFLGPNGEFFCSDLAQATSYDALNFATAEGAPDKTIGLIADHRQALLFGTDSLELWEDVGGNAFPFARASNGFVELGCAAGYSIAKLDNSPHWLASDLTVRRLDGLTPIRVSQHGVEQAIRSYAVVSDARGFSFTESGHIFYVLTFPTAGHTWVLDATTHEWHERESYGLTRWRPCATALCYNRNYVQDFETGDVGYIDAKTFTDWGKTQRMSWTYPSVYDKGDLKFHSELSVRVQTGLGLSTGQGSQPKIQLECSDNGGITFEHVEDISLGRQGHFNARVAWEQLGMADERVYRNTVSEPIPVTVSDAQVTVT